MANVLDTIKNPEILSAMAAIAAFIPPPEGPITAAALRLAAAWLQAGLDADAVNAIVAKYSAEAQTIANNW